MKCSVLVSLPLMAQLLGAAQEVKTGTVQGTVAACFGPPPPPPGAQACNSWTQQFEIVLNRVTYPIRTYTSVRGCIQGMTIQVLGNLPGQNATFTIGNVN